MILWTFIAGVPTLTVFPIVVDFLRMLFLPR